MEGWLCWTETDSHYVLRGGLVPEPFGTMWSLLRDVVVLFMRCFSTEPGQHSFTPAARKAAHDKLWKYAKLAEQVRHNALCPCTHSMNRRMGGRNECCLAMALSFVRHCPRAWSTLKRQGFDHPVIGIIRQTHAYLCSSCATLAAVPCIRSDSSWCLCGTSVERLQVSITTNWVCFSQGKCTCMSLHCAKWLTANLT